MVTHRESLNRLTAGDFPTPPRCAGPPRCASVAGSAAAPLIATLRAGSACAKNDDGVTW